LRIPRVYRGDRIAITMREAEVQVMPGPPTRMWTYDGDFPGPTIRRPAGRRTEVSFAHRLPAEAGELSVHLHGGHNRSEYDGQPGGLTRSHPHSFFCEIPSGLSARSSGNDLLIHPGARKTYVYDLVEGGRPERAAFQWYHDHRLDQTARHVWRGLAGMWIVDDEFDRSLPLPSGERDLPLMIGDRSFDRHNQLLDPFGSGLRPPDDAVVGNRVLVNGGYLPYHRVEARRYRLRLLNISNFRAYDLHLSDGSPMVQIATDSGLMPRPASRSRILLGPAERAEAVVDFSAAAGRTVELRSGGSGGGRGTRSQVGAVLQFRVGSKRVRDDSRVPRRLRPLPAWTEGVSEKPDRTWTISIGGGFRPVWQINGRTFNPAHSEAFPLLGTTETWEIVNQTAVAHMMHLHHTDWYLLSRNGQKPPPWEDCLKETFLLRPGERIRVAGHFSDYTGKFVVHCHMLDHEDHGLMSQFEVVRQGGRG
jgi:spore coat protein A